MIIEDKVISQIIGRAIPKPAPKQNTDDILPAQFLKEITFANMGNYVYHGERLKDGILVPEHPFNNPKYAGANILVAGADYGCGSSREHAPQGLYRFGLRAIVAESFHEIFAGNCASIGLVPVVVDKDYIAKMVEVVEKCPTSMFEIDLESKKVILDNLYGPCKVIAPIDIPEGRRQAFLNGTWDALSVLQADEEGIRAAEGRLPYPRF